MKFKIVCFLVLLLVAVGCFLAFGQEDSAPQQQQDGGGIKL